MGVQKAPPLLPSWKEKALSVFFLLFWAHQHGSLSQMPPASSFLHRVKIANTLESKDSVISLEADSDSCPDP